MIDIRERSCWDRSRNVVLIGPGGAGKSSLGTELAFLLNQNLIDLDTEFNRQIENIGEFIRQKGYETYKLRNSALAERIVLEAVAPALIVTSSGFLTEDNSTEALALNRRIMATCYSVCLLPSRDMEEAVNVIVERQSRRPFTRDRAYEERTIRKRYPEYVKEGDMLVFSMASSRDTAEAIACLLLGER